MTDPSNTRPFEDKQSLSMSTQAAYNKLLEGRGKKEPTTHLEVVKFWLQRSGCKWCYNDKGYYWFNKETHVWELYRSLTEWLLRFKLSEDTPSKELKEMFPCVLKTNKDEGSIKKLPKPSGVIPFSNGVFDIKKGKFRVGAEPQDYLLSLGENFYYWDYEGEKPVEILHLIDMMSGGDEKLRELILAVCWLNIVGVQERRYDGFKNCFILWTSKDGYSGRSTLFNILDTCSGNRICHLERLEDLTDANTLSRLEETNAVYCDERESVTSARANWVSILKRMVGGHQPLEVKKLYKDKFILKGHWVVNQATNNEELFYDVGKALEERIITIKTQTIPKVEIDKFNSDLVRTTRLYSEEEATRFVYYLYKKFPYFEDCLSTISKLKLEFAHETRKIADSSSPFDGFLEECLEPSAA